MHGSAGGGGGGAVPQPPGLNPRNFGVLTGARRCRTFPGRNAWLKLVRCIRGSPKACYAAQLLGDQLEPP